MDSILIYKLSSFGEFKLDVPDRSLFRKIITPDKRHWQFYINGLGNFWKFYSGGITLDGVSNHWEQDRIVPITFFNGIDFKSNINYLYELSVEECIEYFKYLGIKVKE